MDEIRVSVVADNVVSPLGLTSAANYAAAKAGQSALTRYEGKWGMFQPFCASLTARNEVEAACEAEGIRGLFTYFERLALLSISCALRGCNVDPSSPRTLFILSTTKGNVDLLREKPDHIPAERVRLGETAKVIAQFFGNANQPLVVSNACISGLSAQIAAMRLLRQGRYDHVVVCGAEVQSLFIVSGFQSLMALSDAPCRPFDIERNGINLGEAAATIIYTSKPCDTGWEAVSGMVRNDAHHISNPSPTAEGSFRCLAHVTTHIAPTELAFVNAHGTGTLYNDEMEAKAIARADLLPVAVNSLKGYFGHTMGAAGVLETIVSMRATDDGTVLATRGFEEMGVSRPLNLSATNKPTTRRAFVKLISGFGGCNASMLFKRLEEDAL